MRKINSITVAIILAFSFSQFNGFAQNNQSPKIKNAKSEKDVYYCPMHHEVLSDKPGNCEKCGMDLKLKKTGGKMNMMAMIGDPFFEKTVDGLKIQVWLQTQEEHRKMMSENMGKMNHQMMGNGMNGQMMNKMMSGTHHIMVKVINEKTGKEVGNTVKMQLVSPSQKSSSTDLIKRVNHFGNGLSLDEKGKYQLTVNVILKDKKSSKVQFAYEVK